MSIIYILIPVAVLLTALGIYLFFWAVRSEQFDDLEKQGMSILFDEEKIENHTDTEQSSQLEDNQKKNSAENTANIDKTDKASSDK